MLHLGYPLRVKIRGTKEYAGVVELADSTDLGSVTSVCAGSSPAARTIKAPDFLPKSGAFSPFYTREELIFFRIRIIKFCFLLVAFNHTVNVVAFSLNLVFIKIRNSLCRYHFLCREINEV